MSRNSSILVLHSAGNALRIVEAGLDRDRTLLTSAKTFTAAAGDADASPFADETAVASLAQYVEENGWRNRPVIVLLGGSSVVVQYFDLPPLRKASLSQAVRLKFATQLHYEIADAAVVAEPTTSPPTLAEGQTRVAANAAPRDLVEKAVAAAERCRLDVRYVASTTSALTAMAQSSFGAFEGLHGVLFVDERASTFLVLDGTAPCVSCEIAVGAEDLATALMRPIVSGEDVIMLDAEKARALRDEVGIPLTERAIESLGTTSDRLLPLLEPVLQKLAKQLTQWMTFASTGANRAKVQRLRIVGPGAAVPGLAETLARRLSLSVDRVPWLEGIAECDTPDEPFPIEPLAPAVAAVRHRRGLPNLIPVAVQRRRIVTRFRRTMTIAAPIGTAALVAIGVLFNRIGQDEKVRLTQRENQLSEIRGVLAEGLHQKAALLVVVKLEESITEFTQCTPDWVGLFKELSLLLPPEFRASRMTTEIVEGRLRLRLTGDVETGVEGRGFDQIVEQTLILLERSPFFREVRLLHANREGGTTDGIPRGKLEVEMTPAYPVAVRRT